MSVSLVQWRRVIGVFDCRNPVMSKNCQNYLVNNFISLIESLLHFYHSFDSAYIFLFTLLHLFVHSQCHGDTELNPGLKNLRNKLLCICHWNLNGLTAHNYSKLTKLKVYISLYKHKFICLSETYLDSVTPDNLLEIYGYNLVCADHPGNIKRDGVCIYYKESLPVKLINLPYLKEALFLEMNDNNKKMIVYIIYRSQSQSNRIFDTFLLNFEQLLSDISTREPTVSIIMGEFNARSSSC